MARILVKNTSPVAVVLPYAGSTAPTGWLLCNGAAISRTLYAGLFEAIGETYGSGDGVTTFNLPDLRGIFIRGAGSQTIGAISYSGSSLGTKQNDQFQGHYHQIQDEYLGNNVQVTQVDVAGPNAGKVARGSGTAAQTNMNAKTIFTGINGTPRVGAQTHPANISLNYIIKV